MDSIRKTAIIVGALFLISYLGLVTGGYFLGPILDAPDYLVNVSAKASQVIIGVLLESINGFAVVGIAVMMFPLLKQRNEGLALGYAGIRVIEAVVSILSSISILPLITLSQEYVQVGAPATSYFQTLGAFTLAERYWVGEMLVMPFVLSALIFYCLLYQSKLIPRWLSGWGFIAAILVLIANLGTWLMGLGSTGFWILVIPIMANELFLAVWLIVKGFNPSAIASLPVKKK